MSGLRLRALALSSSLIALLASLLFSVAITRKLSLLDVGIINVFSAAISLGTIPSSVTSFITPRLAAKYRTAELGALYSSIIISIAGALISSAFTLALRWRIGEQYFALTLALAALSSLATSISAATTGALTSLNRPRLLYTSLVTSAAKMVAVYYILASSWSLESVLVSSFAIYAAGLAYSIVAVAPYISRTRGFRGIFREFISGSWVPLVGYASNSLRSLDTMFIAAVGGLIDNAIWQVISMTGKLYGFTGNLINVSYGELLSGPGGRRNAIYMDMLLLLFTSTAVSLTVVLFEPYIVRFLRPTDPYLVPSLVIPVAIWASSNVLGTFSQYISAVMQGVDRVDMGGEVTARTYLGSMVLRAHLAELTFTLTYLASIYPLMLASRLISSSLYAIYGAILAGLLSTVVSLIYRARGLRDASSVLGLRGLMRDYALPTAAAVALLIPARRILLEYMAPTPSAYLGILEIVAAASLTGAIYIATSMASSPRFRRMAVRLWRRVISSVLG